MSVYGAKPADLPTIQDYFSASSGQIQLLATVAQLCVAAFVLAAGSLGDLYGRKRIFLLGGLGVVDSLKGYNANVVTLTVGDELSGQIAAAVAGEATVTDDDSDSDS